MDKRDISRFKREFATGTRDYPLTVAVDLDGVICHFNKWRGVQHFGKIVKDTREALRYMRNNLKCKIVIFTTRVDPVSNPEYSQSELLRFVRDFLTYNKIPFDSIAKAKPLADFYVDDRAVRFQTWEKTVRFIKTRTECLRSAE